MSNQAEELRRWIVANYENPDLTHEDFRVEAYGRALTEKEREDLAGWVAKNIPVLSPAVEDKMRALDEQHELEQLLHELATADHRYKRLAIASTILVGGVAAEAVAIVLLCWLLLTGGNA
ncbi:MAG: hypothetical protein KF765_12375 [Parvibaculaceae bacterium]|nr:hypothetical protein [Parvibaculaceae bacterium]